MKLEEVAVTTNEEDETVEFKMYPDSPRLRVNGLVARSYSVLQRIRMNGRNEGLEMSSF